VRHARNYRGPADASPRSPRLRAQCFSTLRAGLFEFFISLRRNPYPRQRIKGAPIVTRRNLRKISFPVIPRSFASCARARASLPLFFFISLSLSLSLSLCLEARLPAREGSPVSPPLPPVARSSIAATVLGRETLAAHRHETSFDRINYGRAIVRAAARRPRAMISPETRDALRKQRVRPVDR